MNPEFVDYNGHGMIERYPKSMSQTYVIGHETRHRVRNRLNAISQGETISQNTSYHVALSNGSAVVKKGVTRSQTVDHKNGSSDVALNTENSPQDDDKNSLKQSNLSQLKKTKLTLEQKIRKLDAAIDNNSNKAVSEENGKDESTRLEKQRLQNKNSRMEKEISSVINEIQLSKSNTDTKRKESDAVPPSLAAIPKEDFATLREVSDVINDSFIFMARNIPGVLLQDGPGSGIQTQNALKKLATTKQPTFFDSKFTFHSDFAGLRIRDLKEFETRLSRLDQAAGVLGNRENFMLKKASTSRPDTISLNTSFDSPVGEYAIRVTEVAKGERVVSDSFEDPFAPLNLSGSFSINGYSISLNESDSLSDIASHINYGEDSNRNGFLDLAEDANASGTLDSIFIPGVMTPQGFTGSFSYFEDVNFDTQLDPSEDLNNNLLLDGGTQQIQVSASIERGRLTLQSISANNISLSDDTGILKEIGFFTEREDGITIRQERQLLKSGTNLNQGRKRAELTVNGTTYKRGSNQVNDIIPSTTISFNQKPSQNISAGIKNDFSSLIELIKEFRSSYNNVMRFINDQELSFKILDKSPHIQNARSQMVQILKTSRPEKGLNQLSASEIGLRQANEKRRIKQASLTNLAELVKKNADSSSAIPFSGQNSLLSALERSGVTKKDNDNLMLDEKTLKRALKNNLNETVSLFTGQDGISSKVKSMTESYLNKVTGVLRLQQDVASIYAENQNILQNQQQLQKNLLTSTSQQSTLNSILSKGVTIKSEIPDNVNAE